MKVHERLKAGMGDLAPVVRVFLDTLPGRLDVLQSAVDNTDYEEIRRAAHRLKGSSSQFGALYLANLCLQAENMARNSNPGDFHPLCEKIREAAREVAGFLAEEYQKTAGRGQEAV